MELSSLRSKLTLNAKYWTLYIRHGNDDDYRVQGISLVDRSYIVEQSHSAIQEQFLFLQANLLVSGLSQRIEVCVGS